MTPQQHVQPLKNRVEPAKRIRDFYVFHTRKLRWKGLKYYLHRKYAAVVNTYKQRENESKPDTQPFPVWVCWWQGEALMPEIVAICYQALQANASRHPIHLITKDNYTEYIDLPDYILEKLNAGAITLSHLSDILRIFLLQQYGGLWIDSTILTTKSLPQTFDVPLFSVKRADNHEYASQGRWSLYLFYAEKGNLLFAFLKTFIQQYWSKENKLIDYLLLDHAIGIAYDAIPAVRRMVDAIPFNNEHIRELRIRLNKAYDQTLFDELCAANDFHKLSYKFPYGEQTPEGKETFYGHLHHAAH